MMEDGEQRVEIRGWTTEDGRQNTDEGWLISNIEQGI